MTASHRPFSTDEDAERPVTLFGPDFPFAYDDWLKHTAGIGSVPAGRHGTVVLDNPTTTTGDDLAAAADTLALVVRQLGLDDAAAHTALDAALTRL